MGRVGSVDEGRRAGGRSPRVRTAAARAPGPYEGRGDRRVRRRRPVRSRNRADERARVGEEAAGRGRHDESPLRRRGGVLVDGGRRRPPHPGGERLDSGRPRQARRGASCRRSQAPRRNGRAARRHQPHGGASLRRSATRRLGEGSLGGPGPRRDRSRAAPARGGARVSARAKRRARKRRPGRLVLRGSGTRPSLPRGCDRQARGGRRRGPRRHGRHPRRQPRVRRALRPRARRHARRRRAQRPPRPVRRRDVGALPLAPAAGALPRSVGRRTRLGRHPGCGPAVDRPAVRRPLDDRARRLVDRRQGGERLRARPRRPPVDAAGRRLREILAPAGPRRRPRRIALPRRDAGVRVRVGRRLRPRRRRGNPGPARRGAPVHPRFRRARRTVRQSRMARRASRPGHEAHLGQRRPRQPVRCEGVGRENVRRSRDDRIERTDADASRVRRARSGRRIDRRRIGLGADEGGPRRDRDRGRRARKRPAATSSQRRKTTTSSIRWERRNKGCARSS